MESKLTAAISVQMKVNLGNYESADAFLSVSGITEDTTQQEVETLLDGPAKVSYDVLKSRFASRVADLRGRPW